MGLDACWVRNRFVRSPGYTATMHVCKSDDRDEHQQFQNTAIKTVIQLCKEGHKIFIPSSSKKIAVSVRDSILRECDHIPESRILLITAETDEAITKKV